LEDREKKHLRLTRIQRLIGRRMAEAKRTKACFYLGARADVTELMSLRRKLGKSLGLRVTSSAFVVRALALAAREFPSVTGRLEGGRIVVSGVVNVGFAVNSSQGLVVPVIKNADGKSVAQIACEENLLTDRARHNKLTLSEIEGETIALSNLGAYGMDSFLGIVPPAASVILAVGNVVRSVVAQGGAAAVRKMVDLSLSADCRVVSESCAAGCLNFIVERLQEPGKLI